MGIFSDSREEDVRTIEHIVGSCLSFYQAKRPADSPEVKLSPNHSFDHVSELGGKILKDFLYPTALMRVATLVVLCNSIPVFSVASLNFDQRKSFVSRFTCLLVQAALSVLTLERDGQSFRLKWKNFPNDDFREQFLTYLQLIEGMKVAARPAKDAREGYERLLAQLSLGLSLALVSCVAEDTSELPAPVQIPD